MNKFACLILIFGSLFWGPAFAQGSEKNQSQVPQQGAQRVVDQQNMQNSRKDQVRGQFHLYPKDTRDYVAQEINRSLKVSNDKQQEASLKHVMESIKTMAENADRPGVLANNEKIFVWKHLGSATYGYPAEVRNFILANIIVTMGKCGLLNAAGLYKTEAIDPLCIQNLAHMFMSPLFYGAFYSFMVGSRYASPVAMKLFENINKHRHKNGRSVMSLERARFLAGQFGMVVGFTLDQAVHKILENKKLHQCAGHVVKYIGSGRETIKRDAMKRGLDKVEISIFSDPNKSCSKAFREISSQSSKDTLIPSGIGLVIAGVGNAMIFPYILRGFTWALRLSTAGTITMGAMAIGVTNLVVFLALSEIVNYFLLPAYKTYTASKNFRSQVMETNESFVDALNGNMYATAKCPESYNEGIVQDATGLCSRVPGVAEIRTFHDFQKAWRQQKLLERFNMAYGSWQEKWMQFHTKFLATKDILREISKMREFRTSGTIKSVTKHAERFSDRFNQLAEEYAEENNRDLNELKEKAILLTTLPDGTVIEHTYYESILALVYQLEQDRNDALDAYSLSRTLNFENIESHLKEDHIAELNIVLRQVRRSFIEARREAMTKLSREERANYKLIRERIKASNSPEYTGSRKRIARYEKALTKLNNKIAEHTQNIWIPFNIESAWFYGAGALEAGTIYPPEEVLDFTNAKTMVYNYIRGKDTDELNLSYALITLKKLSNITPITPAKERMAEALKNFKPLYQYRKQAEELMKRYALQAGDLTSAGDTYPIEDETDISNNTVTTKESLSNMDAYGDPICKNSGRPMIQMTADGHTATYCDQNSISETKDDELDSKNFWKRAPRPFANADLYDYVLTSALCNGEGRFVTEQTEDGHSITHYKTYNTRDGSGLYDQKLHFEAPLLTTQNNHCQNAISLNYWRGQYNMSVKSSLFRDTNDWEAYGLMEIAIFDDHILSFMNNEDGFNHWWNANIFHEAATYVKQSGENYREMVNTLLLPFFDQNDKNGLAMAVEGAQVYTNWNREYFGASFDNYMRDMVKNMVTSFWSEESEHSNFRQSEDLFQAYANEFGILGNYLNISLKKMYSDLLESTKATPKKSAQNYRKPIPRSAQVMANSLNSRLPEQYRYIYPGISSSSQMLMASLDPVSSLMTSEFNAKSVDIDQFIDESVKNIKQSFLNVLITWGRVNRYEYEEALKSLRSELEYFASLVVPTDNALDAVKRLQGVRDELIGGDQKTPTLAANLLLKRKLPMVILNEMSEILDEVTELEKKRTAENFNFDINNE